MDETTFWQMIAQARETGADDDYAIADILTTALTQLPEAEIIAFDILFDQLMAQSYIWDLWAAAFIINGGCSNDCFDYFRGWLIAQGEAVFKNALRDPETLVDVVEVDSFAELEDMLYVAMRAYEEKTGAELPAHERIPIELTGEEWDEDAVDEKYPRLAAKFNPK